MRQATRDTLLWLAGLGGAVVLVRTALDVGTAALEIPPLLLGVLVVLAAAVLVLLVRSRLADDRAEPLAFTEHRP